MPVGTEFCAALRLAPVGIFVTDTAGRCVWVNEAWSALTGMTEEQAQGGGWMQALHPDDAHRVLAAWGAYTRGGRPFVEQYRFRLPGGAERWVEGRSRAMTGEDGQVEGHVGSVFDVGTLEEAQLETREAALAEVSSRLRTVLDATTEVAIIATDLNGIVTVFNTGAEKMLGYLATEVVGLATPERFHDMDEVRGFASELSAQLGTPIEGMSAFVARSRMLTTEERGWTYLRKDGSRLRVSLALTSQHDGDGNLIGYVGVAKDITAQVTSEAALRQAKEAAEAANRAKSEFLANVSHEIRTPLNGVLGLLELTITDPDSTQHRERLILARRSAESLLLILNGLLDFSRIEAGKMPITPRPFGLRSELERLAQVASVRALEKQLVFRHWLDDALPAVLVGDADRLRQILNNLLDNALKFTDHGCVMLRVRSETAGARLLVTFEVIDTGIGIPENKRSRVFAPFEQVDGSSTRQHGGTGLGLAICAELTRLMGGSLQVDSVVGQGSTFSLTLPFALARPTDQHASVMPLPPPSEALPPQRVLLAEDNPINQLVATKMLERDGHRVWLAEDGEAALRMLLAHDFDVVLMDVQMPLLDGLEATRRLRSLDDPRLARLAVVALTARASAEDRSEAEEAGVDAYLVKPFRSAELTEAMCLALRRRGALPGAI
jgi:PAS domain S-box-containing protein